MLCFLVHGIVIGLIQLFAFSKNRCLDRECECGYECECVSVTGLLERRASGNLGSPVAILLLLLIISSRVVLRYDYYAS